MKRIVIILSSLVPPVIVDAGSSASHITVREGLSLTLTCRGDGVPSPKVTWRREDGRPIFMGDKKKESKKEEFHSLIINCICQLFFICFIDVNSIE